MHYIKNIILIIIIFTLITAQDYGAMPKGVIKGNVIDSLTELPLEYTTICVVKVESQDDKANFENCDYGMQADENGMFFIKDISYGYYQIEVDLMGYTSQFFKDALYPTHLMVDLETIKLDSKAVLVEGVTVVEEKPIIEEISKTVYPVKETARESSGSAEEVLEQIPGVGINSDGKLELRGNLNVKVLINGRKTKIDIDMLNADMIEKVEVMTIPDSKYDPDGTAGIINIVLSKNEYEGTSGNIGVNIGEWDNNKLSGTINRLKNDFNIFSSFSYRDNHRMRRGKGISIDNYSDTGTGLVNIDEKTQTISIGEKYPKAFNFQMGFENYFDEKSMLAFDVTLIDHEKEDSTSVTTIREDIDYNNNTNNGSRTSNKLTVSQESGEDLTYGIGYYYDDAEKGKHFDIQFDVEDFDSKYQENVSGTNLDGGDASNKNYQTDYGKNNRFKSNYKMKLSDLFNVNEFNNQSTFEVGLSYEEDIENVDAYMVGAPYKWDFENSIQALYFNTQYQLTEPLGIQIGARFESQEKLSTATYSDLTCTDDYCRVFNAALDYAEGKNLIKNGIPFIYDKKRTYPTFYLSYKLSEGNTIKLGSSRRVNKPHHFYTNAIPNVEGYESRFIRLGNITINPEDMKKTEISFINNSFGYFKTTLFYDDLYGAIDWDKDFDSITTPAYCSDPTYTDTGSCTTNGGQWNPAETNTYSILTQKNLGESIKTGFEVVFATKFSGMDFMFYGSRWHNEVSKASGVDDDQVGDEWGFWGMLNLGFKLKNDQKIKIYTHYSTPMKITTGEIEPFRRFDISYRKKVSDRLSFNLKIKDLFNTSGFGITVNQKYDINGTYNSINGTDYNYTTINDYYNGDNRRGKRTLSLNLEYRFGAFEEKKYRREKGGNQYGGEGGGDMQGGGY